MSSNSIDSDVFLLNSHQMTQVYPDQTRLPRPIVFNSTEMSGNDTREMILISSNASPEQQVETVVSDWNEPTMPYRFGRQLPNIPPTSNDLNLPLSPFNILATMAAVDSTGDGHDDKYSPDSPEPSDPSAISTPPMNLSTIDGWETPPTTMDDNTFYSEDEPRRAHSTSPWVKL